MTIKRVLHVIPSLGSGGAEKLLTDLIKYMQSESLICEVAILSEGNNFYLEKMKSLGVTIYISKEKNVYSLKNISFIKKILDRNTYDIIHTHLYGAQLYTVIAKIFVKNDSILITTEHSTHNRRRDIYWFKIIDYIMYKRYKGIISITQEAKTKLNSYLVSTTHKTVVICNGIDLDVYRKAEPLSIKQLNREFIPTDKIVMMVAAMREEKDHETLIRATKYLPNEYKVVFVGTGYREDIIKNYAEDYKNIYFLGQRDDIPQLLKSANLLVLSSHWEGFGLVVIEAKASGLPVIASNVEGLASVVESIGGILFTPGDEKDLANKILQVNQSKNKEYELNQYDINYVVEQYMNFYESFKEKC